jgi:hypothetical protein
MLADRASSLLRHLPRRGQRLFFLRIALILATIPGLCNLLSNAAPVQRCPTPAAAVSVDDSDANQPAFQTTPSEQGSLFSITSVEVHNPSGGLVYWQPTTWSSSRIILEGLVLSYLCDSARHQCTGVQLI